MVCTSSGTSQAPFSAGLYPGVMSNPFVILRFSVNGDGRESEPATIYTDGFTGALYLDNPPKSTATHGLHRHLERLPLARRQPSS